MRRLLRSRGLLVLAAASLLCAVGLAAPSTTSGFTSKIRNSTNTAASNSYFKCSDYFTANAATANAYFEYPMTDGATSTSATDSSANAATGTYGGNATRTLDSTSPFGCPRDTGSAEVFNGSSTYLTTPTSYASPQTFSIEVWFKTSAAAGKLIGFGSSQTGSSGQYDRHLYITSNGTVAFGTYNGGVQVIQSSATVTDGKWHQAVGTFTYASATSGQMCLYLDGALAATCITNPNSAESNTGYWRIGYDNVNGWTNQPSSYFFSGSMRFAAAYKTVLSSSEIAAEYAAGKAS